MKSSKLILLLLFLSVFGLILYTRSFVNSELTTIQTSISTVREQNVKHLSRAIDTQVKINKVPMLLSKLRSTPNLEKKLYIEGLILDQINDIEKSYLVDITILPEELALYEYFTKNWLGYKELLSLTVAADKNGETREAELYWERSLIFLERLSAGMQMIVAYNERGVSEQTDSIIASARSSKQNVLGVSAGVLIIVLFIGFVGFSKIIATEDQLRSQVKALAETNSLLHEKCIENDRLAYHDALTGLPNRLSFQNFLSAELADPTAGSPAGAVVFLDLDNFKNVNDTFGHDIGDEYLIIIASRIQAFFSGKVFGGRFGGDEFALCLPGYDEEQTGQFIGELFNAITLPVTINDLTFRPASSAGASLYPRHGTSSAELLKKADIAMFHAKELRSHFAIYNENVAAQSAAKHRMEQCLKDALERNELFLVYQPIVDSSSRSLVGLEALLRWKSADYGEISPAGFIPIAETTGIIVPIGEWVIAEAVKVAKIFQAYNLTGVFISVNVSIKQLEDTGFIEVLKTAITQHELPAGSIKIELTESTLIQSFTHIQDKIDQIRALGIQVCLDDFGTGYSSLNYLTKLPIDILKLDRSLTTGLIQDRRLQTVFEHLVRMAHEIGIRVVAEGVETDLEFQLIQQLDCDYVQGYYVSKPIEQSVLIGKLIDKEALI